MKAREDIMKALCSYYVEISGDAKRSRQQSESLLDGFAHALAEKLRSASPHIAEAVFARSSIQDQTTLIEAAFAEAADLIDPEVSKIDTREFDTMTQLLTERYLWPKLRAAGVDNPEQYALRWEPPQ